MAEVLGNNKRAGIVAAAVAAVIILAAILFFSTRSPAPPPAPPPAASTAPIIAPPVFDVVRVDAQGNTVLAGRAAPGASVTIKSGDSVIGTAKADSQGAFVILPENPLKPGAQEFSLSETTATGTTIAAAGTVSVNVPAAAGQQPLAVASGPNGSAVLTGQGPLPGQLGMGTVDYDAQGHAIFSGTAPAGAAVTVALNGTRLGSATADIAGRWTLTTTVPTSSGTITLGGADADGATLPTVTAPFALETLANALQAGHVVIEQGDNLWVIARHVYGHGNMYTLIYSANSSQIHDPNLIFPGQAFALPKAQ
jgi:nucleoid-associated protein YgaU